MPSPIDSLPEDLKLAYEEMELCAMGISEAPDNKTLGRLLTRILPIKEYFVWAHKFSQVGQHDLIVSMNEVWVAGVSLSEQVPIFDSRQRGSDPTKLCQWAIAEINKLYPDTHESN